MLESCVSDMSACSPAHKFNFESREDICDVFSLLKVMSPHTFLSNPEPRNVRSNWWEGGVLIYWSYCEQGDQ